MGGDLFFFCVVISFSSAIPTLRTDPAGIPRISLLINGGDASARGNPKSKLSHES